MSKPEANPGVGEEPAIFDHVEEDAERRSDQRAQADVAAGRVAPHEQVRKWLLSLGSPNPLPRPRPWAK